MDKDYRELPPAIPKDVIERVKKLNTALLCDGMKGLGVPMDGCMSAEIMPVNKNSDMLMIGTALTVETDLGDNWPIHVATYSAAPGYVMVIDGKGYKERPYFGDLIAGAAKAVGVEGMVIDGYTRDSAGCIALDFPVYSKGIMQRCVIKENPGKINVPITCGNVRVSPGDLVVGDRDGITVVPREKMYQVLEAAEAKAAYEEEREKMIARYAEARKRGEALPQLAPQWVLDLMAEQNN